MRKIILSVKNNKNVSKVFCPESFANNILLNTGFEQGKEVYIKYKNAKLTVRFENIKIYE